MGKYPRDGIFALWTIDDFAQAYRGAQEFEKFLRAQRDEARLEIARLSEWIREEGERTDVCTFHILGCEVCRNCRCERGMKERR